MTRDERQGGEIRKLDAASEQWPLGNAHLALLAEVSRSLIRDDGDELDLLAKATACWARWPSSNAPRSGFADAEVELVQAVCDQVAAMLERLRHGPPAGRE